MGEGFEKRETEERKWREGVNRADFCLGLWLLRRFWERGRGRAGKEVVVVDEGEGIRDQGI